MADILVASDVLVDHLRGHARFDPARDHAFYSVVTRAELFAGRNVDEEAVRTLLAPMVEILLDREIAEAAGRIRREVRVALPNAIVAATALARAIPVVTRNRRHFEGVRGLRVRAPR